MEELEEMKKSLAHIESLLQRMPEIQAAVFITMWEEWEKAKFCGRSAKDLWEIIPPNVPQIQYHGGADSTVSERLSGGN